MDINKLFSNACDNVGTLRDASRSGNFKVLASLLGPAVRGFVFQNAKGSAATQLTSNGSARFNWEYGSDQPELARLYAIAKQNQWDGARTLDWSIPVDPLDPARELFPDDLTPFRDIQAYRQLPDKAQRMQRHSLTAFLLSQFLHGEQGALFAACQVTVSVESADAKLFGASQVVDEGRHVEVFNRYLTDKLDKRFPINDNLYVILDALMTDSRWDIKFLGMQILIEGLALGAFGTMRTVTREPLLRELLKYVIADEARHVHFGVVALREYYVNQLPESERRDREDWAYEISLFLRNRFLCHEFYEEHYAPHISRKVWNELVLKSPFMQIFRQNMFRRLIPNLKRINLLTDRVRPHYAALGLLEWEHEKAAPDLTDQDLLAG